MRQSHGRFGLVDMLTARTAGFTGFVNKIRVLDLHLHLVCLGQHRNRCGRGLNASLRFGFWHALYAVHARFKTEMRPRLVSLDHKGDLAVAAEIGGVGVNGGKVKALLCAIHAVHAVQHARK